MTLTSVDDNVGASPRGARPLIAVRRATDDALASALTHLVGRSRAFLLELGSVRKEIGSLNDERAAGLVESIGRTLGEQAGPGTLRHVERAASLLLRSLNEGEPS